MCGVGRPRDVIMLIEGQRYIREEGDEDTKQFNSTEIQKGDVVCRY